jgi:hypothetical protein
MPYRNNSLRDAIEAVRMARNDDTFRILFRELLNSNLLIAVDDSVASNTAGNAGEEPSAPILRLANSAGEAAVFAFTDLDALNDWRSGCPFVELNAKLLFRNLIALDVDLVVVNIGGPTDAVVPRKVFGSLAHGIVPIANPAERTTLPPGTTQYYGQASGAVAEALRRPLYDGMRTLNGVRDAFLMERRFGPDGPSDLVLAIGFAASLSSKTKGEIMDQVGAIANQVLSKGESLVIQELDSDFRNTIKHRIQPLLLLED